MSLDSNNPTLAVMADDEFGRRQGFLGDAEMVENLGQDGPMTTDDS